MRINRLAFGLCLAWSLHAAGPTLVVGPNDTLFIFNPDKASVAELTDPAKLSLWRITARHSAKSPEIEVPLANVTVQSSATGPHTISLRVDRSVLNPRDTRHYGWTVTFPLSSGPLRLSVLPPSTGFLAPAKNKDDANIYFFGSYLAGEATKPIYSIDAKIAWVPEIHESGIFAGIEAAAIVNSGSQPPANRTRVDPDFLTGDIVLHTIRGSFLINAYPARGEFSRKSAESNFVPAATVQWAPEKNWGRHAVAFYPSAGIEAGTNLNKPSTIFKQPVNLSGYDAILRGVVGAYGGYYHLKSAGASAGDPYAFQATMTYVGRILAHDEPYVTSVLVRGVQTPLILLDNKMRHHLDGVVLWNVSDYVGIQAKYTYGSLPPLFQACAHQVTLGITFKAKIPGHI